MEMENSVSSIWNKCLDFIKDNVPESSFRTWFSPIVPVNITGDVLKIQVPSAYFYEYLEENYVGLLRSALQKYMGAQAKLMYSIVVDAGRSKPPVRGTAAVQPQNLKRPNGFQQGYTVPGKIISQPENRVTPDALLPDQPYNPYTFPGLKIPKIDPQLNSNYTLDNFVVGKCNQLGRSAAESIAEKPGKTPYNPFMIFGNSGLGKTHLAQAIGNSVKEMYPEKLVLYVEANKFQTQYSDACRNNTRNDFIHFYQMLDLLIIDDVQEFAGKVGTQDTFFAIFNSLHQSGKQIILTCDTMPSELKGLNDRLLSRFRWGLTAEVSAPDFQTRLNILKKKVYNDGMEIPDDILEYIAQTVVSNVRELEGTLISLLAASTFTRCDLTLETAQNLLGKIVKESNPEYSVDFIVRTVCGHFGIKESVLSSKSRTKDVAAARQLSMYFAKRFTDLPYKVIGERIGGRDHSTVLHACKAVAKALETDVKYKDMVNGLEAVIKAGEK
jgi:chromosomal replication initiator protein